MPEERYHRRERPLGAFTRTVSLGERLDPDRTQATYTQRHPPGAARPRARGDAQEDPDPELSPQRGVRRRFQHGDHDDDSTPTTATATPARRETAERALGTVAPRVDIYETDKSFVLLADMPGVAPDGLEVVAERDELIIRGRVEPPATAPDYQEFELANYYRAFTLTEDLDTAGITATCGTACCGSRSRSRRGCSPRRSPSATE